MMNAKPTITTTDWTRNDGAQSTLKQPTLNELLAITFEERQYSRPPQLIWLCMGGYRRSRFAAPHMSAFGTKRTSRHVRYSSAFGGKADIRRRLLWSTLRLFRRQLVRQLRPLVFDHGPHFIRDVVDVFDFEQVLMEAPQVGRRHDLAT